MLCLILNIYTVGFIVAFVIGAIATYMSPVKYHIADAFLGVITFAAFWFFTIPSSAIYLLRRRNVKQKGGAPC